MRVSNHNISKWLFFSIVVIGGILFSINAKAEDKVNENSSVIEKIELALDAFYRMDFERSVNILDKAIKENPDDPLLYLFKGGFYLERFRFQKGGKEEENSELKEKILSLNRKVIELAEKRIKDDPLDMDARYFSGAGYGNIGRLYIINGQWWNGFWSGKKGFKLCETVVNNKPDYYDAYLGLGLYHYFSSTVPKFVKILSFLLGTPESDKELGISEVKLVRDNSRLLSVEARRILLRMACWEKDWGEFYSGSKWLAGQYPENIYFQVFYIYGLAHNNQWKEAQDQLNKVNSMIEDNPDRIPIPMRAEYFRYSGFLSFHLKKYTKAVYSYLEAINLSKSIKPSERIWAEDYYYLAASYAQLMEKNEAFLYLNEAIDNGWGKDTVIGKPEWKPFIEDPEFIKITGMSKKIE